MLKNTNAVVCGGERFTEVDGNIVKADELEDISHSRKSMHISMQQLMPCAK